MPAAAWEPATLALCTPGLGGTGLLPASAPAPQGCCRSSRWASRGGHVRHGAAGFNPWGPNLGRQRSHSRALCREGYRGQHSWASAWGAGGTPIHCVPGLPSGHSMAAAVFHRPLRMTEMAPACEWGLWHRRSVTAAAATANSKGQPTMSQP